MVYEEKEYAFFPHLSNKFFYLMRLHRCAHYMAIAYVLYIYAHMAHIQYAEI